MSNEYLEKRIKESKEHLDKIHTYTRAILFGEPTEDLEDLKEPLSESELLAKYEEALQVISEMPCVPDNCAACYAKKVLEEKE